MLAVRLGLVGALATLGSPAQQYKCGSCPLSLNYKTKCSKCPINHQNKCHPTARGTKVIVAGCIWAKNNHQRGIGILAAAKLYPKGSSKWKAVACEYECACMCASTPGCLSFDFRSADNKLCRMYKAPTRKANVPCRFNQHHWTKGSCSSSPSPPPAPPPAPGCPAYHAKYSKSKGGAFVTPIVTQTAYGNNGATFQLSVLLEGQAASLYSIHGTSKGPLSMPPAYQSSKSPLVGAPNPLYKQGDDSYLTVGLPYVNKKQIAASPKFPAWTASKGLWSKNAAVFWMNPKKAPSHDKSILVAQVTVKVPCSKKWSAEMGMTGYKLNGQAWRNDDVVFAWSKFAMPKPGCPVYIPPSSKDFWSLVDACSSESFGSSILSGP